MIICAYHGIDKEEMGSKFKDVVYLPITLFEKQDKIEASPALICAVTASYLHHQGKIVILDHYREILNQLNWISASYVVAYPMNSIEEEWVDSLLNTYRESEDEKDKDILIDVIQNFKEDIRELSHEHKKITIADMRYDLWDGIHEAIEEEKHYRSTYTVFLGVGPNKKEVD